MKRLYRNIEFIQDKTAGDTTNSNRTHTHNSIETPLTLSSFPIFHHHHHFYLSISDLTLLPIPNAFVFYNNKLCCAQY